MPGARPSYFSTRASTDSMRLRLLYCSLAYGVTGESQGEQDAYPSLKQLNDR